MKHVGYVNDLVASSLASVSEASEQTLLAYGTQCGLDRSGLQPDTRQRYVRQVIACRSRPKAATDDDLQRSRPALPNHAQRGA